MDIETYALWISTEAASTAIRRILTSASCYSVIPYVDDGDVNAINSASEEEIHCEIIEAIRDDNTSDSSPRNELAARYS